MAMMDPKKQTHDYDPRQYAITHSTIYSFKGIDRSLREWADSFFIGAEVLYRHVKANGFEAAYNFFVVENICEKDKALIIKYQDKLEKIFSPAMTYMLVSRLGIGCEPMDYKTIEQNLKDKKFLDAIELAYSNVATPLMLRACIHWLQDCIKNKCFTN